MFGQRCGVTHVDHAKGLFGLAHLEQQFAAVAFHPLDHQMTTTGGVEQALADIGIKLRRAVLQAFQVGERLYEDIAALGVEQAGLLAIAVEHGVDERGEGFTMGQKAREEIQDLRDVRGRYAFLVDLAPADAGADEDP